MWSLAISSKKSKPHFSFIVLMALLMSFVALAIDAMLPALDLIGEDLKVPDPNQTQWVISSIFMGMGLGLIFFGPLSDAYGRKPAIYSGLSIFSVGCLISIMAQNFETMLIGRLLQGLGGASCRVVTVAMIRDRFAGKEMAKVMSLIMIIFILVPALAPSMGQLVLYIAHWRFIFAVMLSLGVIGVVWLKFGIDETLAKENRTAFSMENFKRGVVETVTHPISRGYTFSAGLIFAAFIGYLNSSQQILQSQYQLGEWFSVVFGSLALCIGMASFANSRWVDQWGMENLCLLALKVLICLAALFLPLCFYYRGHPPLWMLLFNFSISFFCFGILFANFNTLAIQPLGHIAGLANSVISSLQTLLSVFFGSIIGQLYNHSVVPVISGFLVLGVFSLHLTVLTTRRTKITEQNRS